MVGLSLYATAIDSSDLVADSGGVYTLGLRYFVTNWVGIIIGWVLAAHFIFLAMYRAGMYTNAEYLEARFGPAARVISALVQVQYRMLVLGIMANTIYLVLAIVCGWGVHAWWAVVAIALLAAVYTALGGLKSVAVTDSFQSVIMVVGSAVLFFTVWHAVGGWTSMEAKLAEHDRDLPDQLLHVGHDLLEPQNVDGKSAEQIDGLLLLGGTHDETRGEIIRRTPAWVVSIAFIIVGLAYSIVNHTQSMRMFGARSQWDMKMSVIVASVILLATTYMNLMIGIMGRALHPLTADLPVAEALQKADSIYPVLVRDLTDYGIKGLVVAGVLAASFSTFDSIGSTLSALLVRDVYARLIVRGGQDHHYLRVGQWLTPVIIFGSFAYVPFFEGGMLLFYLELVGSFVTPLLTIYLMGAFTRVHRTSGAIALAVGCTYGTLRLLAPLAAEQFGVLILPAAMIDKFAAYLFSVSITAVTMVLVSLVAGWEPRGRLLHGETTGWLQSSQQQIGQVDEARHASEDGLLPVLLGIAVIIAGAVISFVVFW